MNHKVDRGRGGRSGASLQSARKREFFKQDKGAIHSRTSIADLLNSYIANHRQVAVDSLERLFKVPVASVMTWLVIGIALALPGGLFVALGNIESLSQGWNGAAKISLFVHRSVNEKESRQLAKTLERRDDVEHVQYISRTQALEEFRSLSGYGDVLEHLDGNPLPAVIVVRPIEQQNSPQITEILLAELQEIPAVEQVVLDLEWVQRLYSIMALGKRMTAALAVLLALGVLLVIGNTIRLSIESRRDEIIIVKLVGGTNAFVRRPFLYTGLWYGLGGGIMSWMIICISLLWLSGPVAELAGLYQSQFALQGLNIMQTLLLWCGSAVLGLLGAWIAVGRHLGAIEPR